MQTAVSEPRQDPQAASEQTQPHLMTAIALIAVAGMAISCVSLYEHFATSTTSFCNFSESFNCDLVNRSTYSTVFGTPVALIGAVGYSLIVILATAYRSHRQTPLILLIVSSLGLGFALYLAYVEKFVLGAWCLLCLTSLSLIFGEAVLSAVATMRIRNSRHP
ncbi:MAG TPA: vitamin K epoxide reductase family protein [Terriglobales bacterium]|jgi:uncharacterized membrane protein|nr:vitamin K epoxide reductase family protein [Terriglobales bacterium]